MKTLTKKFRAVVHDGLPQEGWHEEQTGETLLPDDALAFEADTLDELRAALSAAGVTVPDVISARLSTLKSRASSSYLWRVWSSAIHFLNR